MIVSYEITDELLHFIKGVGPKAFSNHIKEVAKLCCSSCTFTKHRKSFQDAVNCYIQNPTVAYLIRVLKKYQIILELVEDVSCYGEGISEIIKILEDPVKNIPLADFKNTLGLLMMQIEIREKKLFDDKLSQLTCLECERLDEAINCVQNNCYLAATVMAVSATEARLHYLIKKKNKAIYKKYFEQATLGGLIKLFDKNEYKDRIFLKLKKIVPERHRPLLDLLNIYRIISVHPKTGSIDYKIANSVLNLTFLFLLDSELRITESKLLKHK